MQRLKSLVIAAYGKESGGKERIKLREAEKKRLDELEKIRRQAWEADRKLAEKLRYNSDAYSDYGMAELALTEMARAMECKNQDNMAECYVMRGRAKAVQGDFSGALADADRGIAMDGSNMLNFLNRADIYRMMGDREKAMADCAKARELDAKSPVAWMLTAELYDEADQKEKAMEAYKILYKLDGKRTIPREYLKDIDPEEYRRMEKEEAKKQKEKRDEQEKAKKKKSAEEKIA